MGGRTYPAATMPESLTVPSKDDLPGEAQAPAATNSATFPIVGVGASAGGLEALSQLLRALPADTGMGFVIVQHLAPERASNLTEILSRATQMPVREVTGDCGEPEVEADHVYVIPPGRDMIITGGRLKLLPQERRPLHRGIDQFFRSLAEDCGHKAIVVVLSGYASDGTLGLEAVKAAGGITFAQDESARHGSMPLSAVESGCVDFVLSPVEIAREIARIARHPYVAPEPEAGTKADALDPPRTDQITQIMLNKTGVDFSKYKSSTLERRINRRMLLHKQDSLPDYEKFLKQTPDEVELLFQDILINVTSFFRDPAACEALQQRIIPKLLEGRSRKEPVRIWSLACSTGEEAYTLAILFTECVQAAGIEVPLQIFATDVNNSGITKARTGLFPSSIAQDVSPERLRRFFTQEDPGYRICKSIRECCVFSRHNVLTDPAFSRLDLISCRNLLIYMEPVLQQQVMPLLHYALKPGGYLWLGSSETAGTSRALFELEDARNKIYARRPGTGVVITPFRPRTGYGPPGQASPALAGARETQKPSLHHEAERIMLDKYAPPGVVVSSALEIVQYRGDTGAYLAPAAGAPTQNLMKMLRVL